ncbi:hypothetical protein [Chitinophaga nivalis]|uniref:Class I lanthipeptide n=1 Tax=Chitinophaga nivalis TaxID=2991709 RepID=A0ABT3ILB6_9BACT|nr:hypothetical protein [Chitinophaga nivalis]MCW3465561.1 hypothetical protein [Chitinophaga nivalis]MCW3484748.1 hypothetical protein [Chitinophaga nivalis]
MKKKQMSLNKRLFLHKSRMMELNGIQQLPLAGGQAPYNGALAITIVETFCPSKRPTSSCVVCRED